MTTKERLAAIAARLEARRKQVGGLSLFDSFAPGDIAYLLTIAQQAQAFLQCYEQTAEDGFSWAELKTAWRALKAALTEGETG